MKFYDVALAQGVHDKVLTYDFFRFVSGALVVWSVECLAESVYARQDRVMAVHNGATER